MEQLIAIDIHKLHIERWIVCLALLLWGGLEVGSRSPGKIHSPCYNCQLYSMMQGDEPYHEKQIGSPCQFPCSCAVEEPQCKSGVTIVKDGCGCCLICARQEGDLCDRRNKCDQEKGLYCDRSLDNGARGYCKAKAARPCRMEGKIYKDGEIFQPDCRRSCTCQNGKYGCVSMCPQEQIRPSPIHCPHPQLVNITGQCCREWTCPLPHEQRVLKNSVTTPRNIIRNHACKKETTAWSSCSVTCGMGVSIRVTNDNDDCQPIQQRRLCFIRPCDWNDSHLKGKRCKNVMRAPKDIKIDYKDCRSVKDYRPKYCSTCKRKRCCAPEMTKTITVEFQCKGDKRSIENFMWIKSCKCHEVCPYY